MVVSPTEMNFTVIDHRCSPDAAKRNPGMHVIESDPNGLHPHMPGAKLDAGKVQAELLDDFANALLAVAEVATYGAEKYTPGGWLHVENGITRYTGALWRHKLKETTEGPLDEETGLLHAAHLAWNALARLELILREQRGNENG